MGAKATKMDACTSSLESASRGVSIWETKNSKYWLVGPRNLNRVRAGRTTRVCGAPHSWSGKRSAPCECNRNVFKVGPAQLDRQPHHLRGSDSRRAELEFDELMGRQKKHWYGRKNYGTHVEFRVSVSVEQIHPRMYQALQDWSCLMCPPERKRPVRTGNGRCKTKVTSFPTESSSETI